MKSLLKSPLAILVMLALALPRMTVAAEEAISGSLTVKVTDRDAVRSALIQHARELGGWFSQLQGDHVTLRVPNAQVEPLMDFALGLGVLTDREITRTDRSQELSRARARLATREEMLEQYMVVLEGASAKAVVTVEHEVTRLVREIEELKGRIRFLENQAGYGSVTVWFQFQDRSAPIRDGSSSFAWLNTLNMDDLILDFLHLDDRGRAHRFLDEPPEGFAPYRSKGLYRAVSPDAVIFRVRSARHEPRAHLDFWKEALRRRMQEAGYGFLDEAPVQAGDLEGILLELTAPHGNDDYTYLLAVLPAGERLLIVEATDEVSLLAARRGAILAAIERLEP